MEKSGYLIDIKTRMRRKKMSLTEREKFIDASTIFLTSSLAKKIPRKVRQTLLEYIRNKSCPNVTNDEWHEIAVGINEHKKDVTGMFLKGFADAMNPLKAMKVQGDPAMTKMDAEIRENLDDIDMDELKSIVDMDDATVREAFLNAKLMKDDYKRK